MKNKKSKGAWMPVEILDDPNINWEEKSILAFLYNLSDSEGMCYPSNDWLAKKMNKGERTIKRYINHLKSKGYIHTIIKKTQTGSYRIIYLLTFNEKQAYADSDFKDNLKDARRGQNGPTPFKYNLKDDPGGQNNPTPDEKQAHADSDFKDNLKDNLKDARRGHFGPCAGAILAPIIIKKNNIIKETNKEKIPDPTSNPPSGSTLIPEEKKSVATKEKENGYASSVIRDDSVNSRWLLDMFNSMRRIRLPNSRGIAIVDTKTERQIKSLRKAGIPKKDIEDVIDKCFADPFHKECRWRYVTLEYVTRSQTINRYVFDETL